MLKLSHYRRKRYFKNLPISSNFNERVHKSLYIITEFIIRAYHFLPDKKFKVSNLEFSIEFVQCLQHSAQMFWTNHQVHDTSHWAQYQDIHYSFILEMLNFTYNNVCRGTDCHPQHLELIILSFTTDRIPTLVIAQTRLVGRAPVGGRSEVGRR